MEYLAVKATKHIKYLAALVLLPSIGFAQNNDVDAIWVLVANWYSSFLLPLGSILAGIVIVIAGIMYAASGGDSTKTGRAKELIIGAITGLILLIGASLIIRTIIS